MWKNNIEALKLLLNVPNIDVNIVDNRGWSTVHWALGSGYFDGVDTWSTRGQYFEVLKLLLSHPSLTALTLNQKDKDNGETPVMLAARLKRPVIESEKQFGLKHLELLVADPRVDLDTTDMKGRRLEEWIWWVFLSIIYVFIFFGNVDHYHIIFATSLQSLAKFSFIIILLFDVNILIGIFLLIEIIIIFLFVYIFNRISSILH